MSFDKTEVIVQTLEGQIQDLQQRSESALLEVPEHEGAAAICDQLAKAALSFDELIEKKLSEEPESVSGEAKDLVRVYCKNLIVRLHNLCDSNAKNQRNLVLIAKGRLKEIEVQRQSLEKLIQSHKAFAENRERRIEEAAASVEVPGAKLPQKDEAAQSGDPPEEEETQPGKKKRSLKKANRRNLKRG